MKNLFQKARRVFKDSGLFSSTDLEASPPTHPQPSAHIKLIVGLGNPGTKYDGTRHNVGFETLDHLLSGTGISFKREKKWIGEIANYQGTYLVKPLTFMNESGKCVGKLARYYNLKPEQILVITDDVTLNTGTIRFRQKGSHGGQNGVKSIINHLGSNEFPRLKLGVGKASGAALTGHVLGKFPPNEREVVENMLATASQAVLISLTHGVEAAANQYNTTNSSNQK